MKLFIFGYGYSAKAIAEELRAECDWIGGTSRDPDKLASMAEAGIEAFLFDGIQPTVAIAEALQKATHILISAGPDAEGDPALRCHRLDIANAPKLKWVGYLSTVGVYGDHQGAWVDESTECCPVSKRSIERVRAEGAWQSFVGELDKPLGIYRLAGIYGPGRNQMKNVEKGKSRCIIKKDQVFNRIHVADIAQVLAKAALTKHKGIMNVCDDEPAPPQDVITYCAELLGVEPPKAVDYEDAKMTPMARSFYGENKRCSNKKLHELIEGDMYFPNYRVAFDHLFETKTWRG